MALSTNLTPWRERPLGRGWAGHPFDALRQEFDDIFDRVWRGSDLARFDNRGALPLRPSVDVSESESDFQVVVELPGLDEKDVEVTLGDDRLTIKGEKKAERDEKRNNYHLVERTYGAFQRSFNLPSEADANKIAATFDKGVLTVIVAKTAAARKAPQKIAIKKK